MELTTRKDLQVAWNHLQSSMYDPKCKGLAAWQRIYVRRCRAAVKHLTGEPDTVWYPHLDLPAEQENELRALIVRGRLMGKWDTEYPLPNFEM